MAEWVDLDSEARHFTSKILGDQIDPIPETVPTQSSNKMLLAIGKGAGSFEVWDCDV